MKDKQMTKITKNSSNEEERKLYNPEEFKGKDVQPAPDNDEHLDEHGRVIHQDKIQMQLQHKDLIFIHQATRDLMQKGLVPEPEIGPCMTLLDILAESEPHVHKHGVLILPVNYFVGMWHVLNSCRKFSIYSQQWKKKDKKLDHITTVVASYIDKYHTVKEHEAKEDAVEKAPAPREIFKSLGNSQKGKIKYIGEGNGQRKTNKNS